MQHDIDKSLVDQDVDSGRVSLETPSGQSRIAYRLAAMILITNVLLSFITTGLSGRISSSALIRDLLDLYWAFGLISLRKWARNWVLFRAVFAALILPLLLFNQLDILTALFSSLANWGVSLSLILLLTGKSKNWRIMTSLVTYGILGLGFMLFTIIELLLVKVQ
jgi:hypothetical protein